MHEMSLAEGVLAIIEDHAAKSGFARVKTVWLEIGALSGVETEAMRFCFDAVTRGSLAEGAALEIDATPGEAWCLPCGDRVALAQLGDPCPRCGSFQLTVTRGDAMRVKDIAID